MTLNPKAKVPSADGANNRPEDHTEISRIGGSMPPASFLAKVVEQKADMGDLFGDGGGESEEEE